MTDIFRSKFIVEMDAVGQRFEVASFTADFGINDIPTATCVLAIGRNAANGTTEAKIHRHLDELKEFVEVKVYFSAEGEWSRQHDWPSGEFVIFEGKIQGIGFQKVNGKVELVAHLQHWLMDLNHGSAINEGMHPTIPMEYTHGAVYTGLFPNLSGAGIHANSFGIWSAALAGVVKIDNIKADLWGEVLKPLLCGLGQQEGVQLNTELSGPQCFDLPNAGVIGPNDIATAALKRIEGLSTTAFGQECSSAISCYTPKLELDLPSGASAIPFTVVDAITAAIMDTTVSSYVRSTLWSKLVEFGETFQFDVIPLADKALVVPKTFGLRNTWCKKIKAADYATVALSSIIDKPMRGVAVVSTGRTFDTGVLEGADTMGVGGCYSPDPLPINGMIHIIRPPAWLENVLAAGHSPTSTTGAGGPGGVSTSTTPAGLSSSRVGNRDNASRPTIMKTAIEMYEAYAHAMYVQNVLRTRSGSLSGKLRFDISPGAVVEIEGTSDKFLNAGDKVAQTLVGTVIRVAIAINAEKAKAGTSFRLRDLRTTAENADDRTSSDFHPLYVTIFKGAPLVDDLLMPEGADCCLDP